MNIQRSKYNMVKVLSMLVLFTLTTISCDDFLDRQEDEQLTFEKIWLSRSYTKQYWINTMSFIPKEASSVYGDSNPFIGGSDECAVAFNRAFRYINFGTWNPSNIPYASSTVGFASLYNGIRECNIFMQNVDKCSDPLATKEELAQWKVQARFARAYYYFHLMRCWGAVYLLGDELIDFTLTTEELSRPRNTWEECVNYVVSELQACISDPAMSSTWLNDVEYGLATKGTCQALISRLTLYSARPLFNGNTMYAGVKNPVTDLYPELSGVTLFPQTFDSNKWKVAADAARTVIATGIYSLYRVASNNPYDNYYGVTNQVWNSEIIWSTGYRNRYEIAVGTVPTAIGGVAYGGTGPTQQQVDAYAMNTGRYPITDYENTGTPVIDAQSGYPTAEEELEQKAWTYPACVGGTAYTLTAPLMYKDREPRFYVSVCFSGQYWRAGSSNTKVAFALGCNSNKSHDYPKAGYLINRIYDHTLNSASGVWGNITFPTMRLAEIYLNYIEAVLECKRHGVSLSTDYETLAMEKWADLRDRVGLKPITDVYPGATTTELIELCRRERRVELVFEEHRFFDTRTWMIATKTDGGPMYGMNVLAPGNGDVTPDDYWKRTTFETRVFKNNHYLYPFAQSELNKNKLLTQNYGW